MNAMIHCLGKACWGFCAVLSGFLNPINAQDYSDTLAHIAGRGEQVRLNLGWTSTSHGSIQWQISSGSDDWNDLAGATTKNLRLNADTSAWFRARVLSGTCDPFYSMITHLQVLDIRTAATDSVTDTEAAVHCSVDSNYIEKGILLDTKPIPDTLSARISLITDNSLFTIKLSALVPGLKYYVRVFVRLGSGKLVMGNILSFSTMKIEMISRKNLTDSSATLWYKITGDTQPAIHGIFYSAGILPDTTSAQQQGTPDNGLWQTELQHLDSGTVYTALPYMKLYNRYCFGVPINFKTYSDYSQAVVDQEPFSVAHKIAWKAYATAKKISQPGVYADYGRVKRIGNSDTLLLVYHGGPNNQDWVNIYLRKSYDNGLTWENHEIMADISKYSNYWRFCNPELIELDNGWILLAYTANGRPETNENCYLHLLTSKDHGETWEGPLLIQTGRSWEPAMVQLPQGEIELFYSSEARWWPAQSGVYMEQEIHMIHSTDNGQTWSYPNTVAYYPGRRDGMPVPLLLQGNRGVVFAIETVNSGTSPYIVKRDLAGPWNLTASGFENSPYRWLAGYFNGHGGAPYLIQLPTGETILSAHIYRGGDWHQNNYMQVMVGDNGAKNFGDITTPWGVLPSNESAVNNSLFLLNDSTIMAISGRNFPDGSGAIYWLEGTIVPRE